MCGTNRQTLRPWASIAERWRINAGRKARIGTALQTVVVSCSTVRRTAGLRRAAQRSAQSQSLSWRQSIGYQQFMSRDYVKAGGLIAYGPSYPDLYRRAA